MYEETIMREYERASSIPLDTIRHGGSNITLFRADQLEAGVKTAIGRGLVAKAIDDGQINKKTKAVVVQGAGNTVTSVAQAIHELGLTIAVIAVVYHETSKHIRDHLTQNSITVVAKSPRKEGRDGRMSVAGKLSRKKGHVFLEQHETELIVDIQKRTFGRRIAKEIPDVTHFVAGVGTGGTVFGIGAALQESNPSINVIAIEGVGSTLSLWHAYLKASEDFASKKQAIEQTLTKYQQAGMLTSLTCNPDGEPEEWFNIAIDFPPETIGVVGIEGLGVGDPSQLILDHLPEVTDCQIVTDAQAAHGQKILAIHCIHAVESAGANFFAAMTVAEELQARGEQGQIVTVVTATQR